jgi:hypothetical protein
MREKNMSDRPVDEQEQLRAILNSIAESIAEAPDSELIEEKYEEGKKPSAQAEGTRAILRKAVSTYKEKEIPSPIKDENNYSIEARLSKSTRASGEYTEENIDLSLAYKRRGRTGSSERFLDRFKAIFAPKFLTAFGFILVCTLSALFIYILRDNSGRDTQTARQVEPKSPTQIAPRQMPDPEKRSENVEKPLSIPAQKDNPPAISKSPRQRGGTAVPNAAPLQDVRTIFINPQESEFHQSLRSVLIEQLQASKILSFTEDRENSSARLKIIESSANQFTFELISGHAVIWTKKQTIEERTIEAASKTAKEIVERLLQDMAASKRD